MARPRWPDRALDAAVGRPALTRGLAPAPRREVLKRRSDHGPTGRTAIGCARLHDCFASRAAAGWPSDVLNHAMIRICVNFPALCAGYLTQERIMTADWRIGLALWVRPGAGRAARPIAWPGRLPGSATRPRRPADCLARSTAWAGPPGPLGQPGSPVPSGSPVPAGCLPRPGPPGPAACPDPRDVKLVTARLLAAPGAGRQGYSLTAQRRGGPAGRAGRGLPRPCGGRAGLR